MVLEKNKERITLYFGSQTLNGAPYNHKGIDIVPLDNIVAIQEGTVVAVRTDIKGFISGSYGNYVKIKHADGYESMYGHLSHGTIKVSVGQKVVKGQVLGYMGETGGAYGKHLHLEIRLNGTPINPLPFLQGKEVPKETVQPIPEPTPIPQPLSEIKVGDTVIVNGIGTAGSDGTGSKTGNLVNKEAVVIKTNGYPQRPYNLNFTKTKSGNYTGWADGWFKAEDVKKI